MAWADILVHLDSSSGCPSRLRLATALAARFGARLTGLYVIPRSASHPRYAAAETEAASLCTLFSEQVALAGVTGEWQCVDWSEIGVGTPEVIIHHAHYSDLVVVGQAVPAVRGDAPAGLPERVVLGAGRPVLIVPCAGSFATVGERVLVAWKAGRESARVVNDVLPLLKQAARVDFLALDSSETYGDDGQSLCFDIRQHLQRHGIRTTGEQVMTPTLSVGDALLNKVGEEGVDLLVTGAFAHTPQGRLALGSLARHLLERMPVPVLMAH